MNTASASITIQLLNMTLMTISPAVPLTKQDHLKKLLNIIMLFTLLSFS